jgi:GNAT superfamily N-acetyltransferase
MDVDLPVGLRGRTYKILDAVSTYFWPDKSADQEHIKAFYDSFELFAHHWSGSRAETWYLEYLCVHPDHHRKSYGKQLLQKGLEYAQEEGVATSVISSIEADSFYSKLGFVEVGNAAIGPIAGVKGGSIKFLDAK